jgi:hypothetical protein
MSALTSAAAAKVKRNMGTSIDLVSNTSTPKDNQDRNFASALDIIFNTSDLLGWDLLTLRDILRSVPESKTDDIDAYSEVNIIEATSKTDDYDVEVLE